MIVALTGTPGTGKSSVAKFLKKQGFDIWDLNKSIVNDRLFKGYDHKRKSYIADLNKVTKYYREHFRSAENLVIDGHLAHMLNADIVIVLRCKPKQLEKRLEKKRWNSVKIKENVEAEMISIISYEARKRHEKVFDVDTTNKTPKQVAGVVENILKGKGSNFSRQIEWL